MLTSIAFSKRIKKYFKLKLNPLVHFEHVNVTHIHLTVHRLLDSLVVEYWLQVREVPGSIRIQGPRHTKDVIKCVSKYECFSRMVHVPGTVV